MPGEEFAGRDDEDLKAAIVALEERAVPLRRLVDEIRAEVDALRTEMRRRERMAQVDQRKAVRAELAAGHLPSLHDWISGAVDAGGSGDFDDFRFMRESATEVRLGYASAARQSLSFTDGRATDDAGDLAAARDLYARGWDFGTLQARGVRIYTTGTRAERVVSASEVHLEPRPRG